MLWFILLYRNTCYLKHCVFSNLSPVYSALIKKLTADCCIWYVKLLDLISQGESCTSRFQRNQIREATNNPWELVKIRPKKELNVCKYSQSEIDKSNNSNHKNTKKKMETVSNIRK